jgi:hypothetical protein
MASLVSSADVPFPGFGQVDQRELQPLAAVHGQHANRALVGLQPLCPVWRRAGAGLGHPGPQPLHQRAHAELAGDHRRVQALAEMPQVGQPALAAGMGQQPLHQPQSVLIISTRAATPRAGQHPAPPAHPLGQIAQLCLVGRGQLGEGPADEAGECGLANRGRTRLLECDQQGEPVLGHRGGEHRPGAEQHRRHLGGDERVPDGLAPAVGPDQDGDVGGRTRRRSPSRFQLQVRGQGSG